MRGTSLQARTAFKSSQGKSHEIVYIFMAKDVEIVLSHLLISLLLIHPISLTVGHDPITASKKKKKNKKLTSRKSVAFSCTLTAL